MHYHHQFGVLVPFAKKYFRVLVLAIAGIFILSQFTWLLGLVGANGNEEDDSNKIVVRPSTLTLDPGKNWYFFDDVANTSSTTEVPGDYEFVDGPGDPPEGDGSVRFEVTGNERWNIATYYYAGTELKDIEKLKFNTFQPSTNPGSPNERAVYLNFDVDFDGDDDDYTGYQGRLAYVPRINDEVEQDQWQEWEAHKDNAEWWWSGYAANGNMWPDGETDEYREWEDILDEFNDISIIEPHTEYPFPGQLLFRAGEPYSDGFVGYLDKVTIEASPKVVYDFEPEPAPSCLTAIDINQQDQRTQGEEHENDEAVCVELVECEFVRVLATDKIDKIKIKYLNGDEDEIDDIDDDTEQYDVPQVDGVNNWIVELKVKIDGEWYTLEVSPPDCAVLGEECEPGPGWADSHSNNNQALRKNGTPVVAERSNPDNALGAPDSAFFSLGFGGSIVLEFNGFVADSPGDDVHFTETTNGVYPQEVADIEVSQDGSTWYPVGSVNNTGDTGVDISSSGLDWIKFVRITDASDVNLFEATADGYDLNAVGAELVCVPPEPEPVEPCFVTVMSDITNTVNEKEDAPAKALSFVHPGWTASIPGATWIWGDDPVVDPSVDETQTFTKSFIWNGPVTSAVLDIASDNTYEIYLNGVGIGSSADVNNFTLATQDQYTATVEVELTSGVNTLEVVVHNDGTPGNSNPQSNPAGLLYKLVVEGEKGCDQPPPPIVECAILVSDFTNKITGTEDPAVHVSAPHHSAWTAEIPGATWIWTEDPLSNPSGETEGSFEKRFTWNGPVSAAVLDVAADNTYEVYLNDALIFSDATENNFGAHDTYDLSAMIVQGENTLKFVVTNLAQDGGTHQSNPAGILYKLVVEGEQGCDEPQEITECVVVVSDESNTLGETEEQAVPVTFIHDAWDALIPGAIWIWTEDPVSDPVGDTFGAFTKSFNWNGPVDSAVLEIAADNSYEVFLNGNPVALAEDASENNHGTGDVYSVVGIQNGVNTLTFEVHNWAQENGTPTSNPAGLLYKLTVQGNEGCEEDPEEPEEVLGSIQGTVYRDDNPTNLIKDPAEPGLTGTDVWLLTHDSPYTLRATTVTDGNGSYLFENLGLGTYYVCQDLQDGWFQTQLNNAGFGGVDLSLVGINEVVPGLDSDDPNDPIADFCWEVTLTEESLTALARDFGSLPNVLGEQDPDPSDDGDVLGEEDGEVLAETGDPAIMAVIAGMTLLVTAIAVTRATKKQ